MLTRSSGRDADGRYSVYEWEGRRIRIHDSAMCALRVMELMRDEAMDPITKRYVLMRLLFCDPEAVEAAVTDVEGLMALACWEACGLDLTGEHADETGGERIFDWQQDEAVIRVSLYQEYGRPWDELARELTYRELTQMMGLISFDTPLGKAIYYRTAPEPKPTRHNAEQVREFRERKAFWKLKDNREPAEKMEAMNNQANDMFLAMERAAKNGERRKRNHQGTP